MDGVNSTDHGGVRTGTSRRMQRRNAVDLVNHTCFLFQEERGDDKHPHHHQQQQQHNEDCDLDDIDNVMLRLRVKRDELLCMSHN